MADWVKFAHDPDGIMKFAKQRDDGGIDIKLEADVTPLLERNKAMRNHNDGYSKSREIRRVASIPNFVRVKWLMEEGWDCFAPENSDRLMRRLNDPDWAYLRTADGQLGISNGVIR
jgi:hypothetical protein